MTSKIFRRLIKFFLYLLLLSIVLVVSSIPYALYKTNTSVISGKAAKRILIRNANFISPNKQEKLPYKELLIEDGQIIAFGKEALLANDIDLVINASQQFIFPGLTDMHTHVIDRSDLLLNLAHGITQIRVMHGLDLQLKMKEEIERGEIIGPDLILASPVLNQKSKYAHSDFNHFLETPEAARKAVKKYTEKGYDLIKVYDGLTPEVFEAIVSEANDQNIPIAGHPPFQVPSERFLAAKPQSLEHIEMLYQAHLDYSKDAQNLNKLISELKVAQVPISTTILVFDELVQAAEQKEHYLQTKHTEYIPDIIDLMYRSNIEYIMHNINTEQWRAKADYLGYMAQQLYQAGVPMILASDSGANFTLHGIGTIQEMELLAHYGVPTDQILVSATITPNQALKTQNKGTIDFNQKADLVFLRNDPRSDLTSFYDIKGLIKDGTYFNYQDIQEMKAQAKNHMNYYELVGWFLIDWWNRK